VCAGIAPQSDFVSLEPLRASINRNVGRLGKMRRAHAQEQVLHGGVADNGCCQHILGPPSDRFRSCRENSVQRAGDFSLQCLQTFRYLISILYARDHIVAMPRLRVEFG